MSEAARKLKRVEPVARVRKMRLDREMATLAAIRLEQEKVIRAMKEAQMIYMSGVDRLNRERSSQTREMLEALEMSIDFSKAKWFKLYKQVQDLERQESAQLAQVVVAQKDMKAIDKIKDSHRVKVAYEQSKSEQKQLDELASRRFTLAKKEWGGA